MRIRAASAAFSRRATVARLASSLRKPAWIAAALVAWGTPAIAHPAPFSYVDVRIGPAALEVSLVAHVYDVAHELGGADVSRMQALLDPASLTAQASAVSRLLQDRLHVIVDGREPTGTWSAPEPLPDRQSLRLRARYALQRPPGVVSVTALMFPYDAAHQTFVNVYEGDAVISQAILGKDRPQLDYFPGTGQGTLAVIRKFAAAGIHHILIGPDHLLFLVGLLLLGGSLRRLLLVVSAFTAAHSVTLSLAALNIFSPPARMVEPAIALSIIYVGADNLTVRGGRDVRGWIAFAFGLVHGFGFASVLREMDLPPRALGWSLFSFNVGVEIGQLLVVIAVASLLAAVRARSEAAGRRLAFAGSVVVIAAGAFWFIERVFFPAGMA
jgi:hydrogenase/urease accessory protein HupE